MLFDAHAHINEPRYSEEERLELARQIEASPVSYVMDVGSNLEDSLQAVRDAETWPWCYAAVGCHPHDAKTMSEEGLEAIRKLILEHDKVKCLGEIGLDFHYDLSPRDVQREWFRRQIRLANELRVPIMIHSREADQETMDILREEGAFSDERKSWFPKRPAPVEGKPGLSSPDGFLPDARVLLHCYSGSAELAEEYVRLGAWISICGPVTFKNNKKTVRVCEMIPAEFLTVETDSPYMAPEPKRGRPNMSPYVEYTCRKVADIKGMS